MAGAIIILVSRNAGALDADAPFGWYLAALVTPAALAAGNVYRSTHWPQGKGPLPLATLTLAAAALGLALVLLLRSLAGGVSPLGPGLRDRMVAPRSRRASRPASATPSSSGCSRSAARSI